MKVKYYFYVTSFNDTFKLICEVDVSDIYFTKIDYTPFQKIIYKNKDNLINEILKNTHRYSIDKENKRKLQKFFRNVQDTLYKENTSVCILYVVKDCYK